MNFSILTIKCCPFLLYLAFVVLGVIRFHQRQKMIHELVVKIRDTVVSMRSNPLEKEEEEGVNP